MNSSRVRLLAVAALVAISQPQDRAAGECDDTPAPQPFPVSALTVEDLIRKPANPFDLEGKTVRFTPQADGSWKVETTATAKLEPGDTPLPTGYPHPFGFHGWRVELPFAFPFAG